MGHVTLTSMRPAEAREHNPPTGRPWITRPAEAFTAAALRERLIGNVRSWRDYPPSLRVWFWLVPALTSLVGGILRFVRLDNPHSLVFDETYYVKDAYSYLVSGYERRWPDKANDSFNAGNPAILLDSPEYVVHPPVGKWMIAGGMWLFGSDNPFGWRFGAALTGTLSVLLLTLIALKLFRSLPLAAAAGLLLAVDGHHLVMSRTSLLDIFLMFWVLAAFGALLLDRDDGRRRLAARLARRAAASTTGRPSGAPAPGWTVAGYPMVAARRRRGHGARRGDQVVGPVLPCRLRCPDGAVGPECPPGGRHPGLDQRGNHQRRPAGICQHGTGGCPGLHRNVDRLVPFRRRLLPPLGSRPTPQRDGGGCRTRCVHWRTTIWRPTSSTRAWARNTRTRQAPGAGW